MIKCTFANHGECDALSVGSCPERCSFYKTEDELAEARERANKRLCELPHADQFMISQKYYKGGFPWIPESIT